MKPINNSDKHSEFYAQTIARVNDICQPQDELCFVYVQHAFSPLMTHLDSIGDRFAALIPKASSSLSNRAVVAQLNLHFPGKVIDNINRKHLRNTGFTLNLLKKVTQGRPFAILEYGAYFAPSAKAIADDADLGPRLAGFVEGTQNGIRGADDASIVGYDHVAHALSKPIISKSRSRIKQIMDRDIGPAIVKASELILQESVNNGLEPNNDTVGVIGHGSIGKGIMRSLQEKGINPLVYDNDLAVMAELAHSQHTAVPLQTILSSSDVIFLNTGSCFLSQQPELLEYLKDDTLLILCTSGDVEAGIPQLIAKRQIQLIGSDSTGKIAKFHSRYDKSFRLMLGSDKIGQAPNLVMEDGSDSLANLMSDMEFYALGCYLGSDAAKLPVGCINESPKEIQDLIIEQWLQVFHPECQTNAPISKTNTAEEKRAAFS